MPRWAKMSERIGQDVELARLVEGPETVLAALLFTWSIAASDLYGILPADPREYAARVCPAARALTDETVQRAIDQQEAVGLITIYDGDGPLLYIGHYHKYQDVRWDRVGAPEHKLPLSWKIPDELRQWLETDKCKRSAAFYGITGELQEHSRSTPGLLPPRRRLDVDTDTDKGGGPLTASSSRGTEQTSAASIEDSCCETLAFLATDGNEDQIRPGIEVVVKAYPDFAIAAAVKTAVEYANKRKNWPAANKYFAATAAGMASDLREAEAVDPPLAQYTRLVGSCPRGPAGHEDVRRWNNDLLEWRREGGQYWIGRRRETWPRLFARAVELGMWEGGASI